MRRVAPLALALACAHSPPAPPGPQPLAGAGELRVGDGAVTFRLAHEPLPDRVLALHVELRATGHLVGVVTWSLALDGFDAAGSTAWSGELPPAGHLREVVRLRPRGDGVARVTLTYGLAGQPDLGAITVPFLVTADAVRPCQPADQCAAE